MRKEFGTLLEWAPFMWAQRQVGYNFLDQVDVTRLHSLRLMSTKKKTS